ncbi:MAG: selenite/tellurite reduction operon porin ExtI [Rhodocyclales bacterium]|nr:selenite/tellurite reduction operon porin ExtI [Rhodocyclales bacterium]
MNMKTGKSKNFRVGLGLLQAGTLLLAGLSAPALAGPTINFNNESYLTVSYSLQVWAQNRGYTSATDAGSVTEFFLRRNRLTFNGQVNDYVGFYAQLEAGNDGKAGDVDKSVYYRDAYVTLDYSDPARFIVGRFKNTFSRENLEACLEPLTLDRAEWLGYTPYAGSRDTGAAVWGNLANGMFQYRLMMANGRQGDNVVKKGPRLTARAHVSLLDPETEYGYLGTYLGTKRVLTIGVAQDFQKDVAYGNFAAKTLPKDYKASTLDIFYEQPTASGTYTLSGAVMRYRTGDAINAASADPNLPENSELGGSYVKAGYLLPAKVGIGRLQFFGRHENRDYHLTSGYGDSSWNSLGANYYIDGQKLKLTAEFAKVAFDKQNPTDPSRRDYKQATVGLQFQF